MGLTGIGMGSVVVVTDLLFLLGEVGRGESSIPGKRALEEREEGLSGGEGRLGSGGRERARRGRESTRGRARDKGTRRGRRGR